MADRYYGRLKQLERDSRNEMSILSDTRSSLEQLTEAMAGEELSMKDYLTLLRLTGQYYEKHNMPPSAQKYIFMRMQSVLSLRTQKWKRHQYPLMTDVEEPLTPEIMEYFRQQRPLWKETLAHFQRMLLLTDLILFLLSKNKIEIQDIPIALILEQYLAYLERRQQMDLEVASEFITMASQLMFIKTRMLLS
ncbi:segregation/condensation protein A, partial [Faecalibaculum rodentium]|uniref:segregation/condensation protein A n=1 Tax=Faecalibaculum rodentium TaxID=1702221 RepID=UPI00272F4956